jgi:dienelactone hydrolase
MSENIGYPEKFREDFNLQSFIQLDDVNKVISDFAKRFSSKNVFILGWSYGGYLANLIATERPPETKIAGYISGHSLWGPIPPRTSISEGISNSYYQQISRPLVDKAAPILIIFSEDDGAVGSQGPSIRKWIDKTMPSHQLFAFEGWCHSPFNKGYPTEGMLEVFARFLLQNSN